MKIAFDVDETITQHPELFSVLAKSLIAAGHEVYIISDVPEYYRADRLRILKEADIPFTKLCCAGNKREICVREGISFLFDDHWDYFEKGDFTNPIIIGRIK